MIRLEGLTPYIKGQTALPKRELIWQKRIVGSKSLTHNLSCS